MPTMRAVEIAGPNQPFRIVEREIPQPGPGGVRVKVQACGICHSDSFVKEGTFPGLKYPRVPGHEVAGVIDAVGPGVAGWQVGQRVGIGWHGSQCGHCGSCRHGDYITCSNPGITGISFDGGYAEYMVAPAESLAQIPETLAAVEAAPLMCAGITTFNALRHSGATAGDTVAIQGIGGLGHLAVQFAAKMGFRTVAIARGKDKGPLARKLGAHHYIDSAVQNVAAELTKLGGARVILTTVTNSKAMEGLIDGLAIGGKLVIVGASFDPVGVVPLSLISGRRSVIGWPSGASMDSQETLAFAALSGVRAEIQRFPLEKAEAAYALMMSGKARFRVVLEI